MLLLHSLAWIKYFHFSFWLVGFFPLFSIKVIQKSHFSLNLTVSIFISFDYPRRFSDEKLCVFSNSISLLSRKKKKNHSILMVPSMSSDISLVKAWISPLRHMNNIYQLGRWPRALTQYICHRRKSGYSG